MDFLRSCATNVRTTSNIFDTISAVYTAEDQAARPWAVLAELRCLGILCASSGKEVWVFGATEERVEKYVKAHRFERAMMGERAIYENPWQTTADGRPLNLVLLEAIEGAVTFALAGEGLYRVGRWTWIFPSQEDDDGILLKLSVQLTEQGCLYVYTAPKMCSFMTATDLESSLSCDLRIIPNGMSVKTITPSQSETMEPFADETAWTAAVSEALRAQGIELLPNDAWLTLGFQNFAPDGYFLWPARLCLQEKYRGSDLHKDDSDEKEMLLKWFKTAGHNIFQDPISFAGDWFASRDLFAEEPTKTSNRTDSSGPDEGGDSPHSPHEQHEQDIPTPSPYNQRNVEQSAMSVGFYPTPPDGLTVPPTSTQQTSDEITIPMDIDDNDHIVDDFLHAGDSAQKRDRSTSSPGVHPDYSLNPDDLFGDLDEAEFGANEVDDADFDYFDQPDDPHTHEDVSDTDKPTSIEDSLDHHPPPNTYLLDSFVGIDSNAEIVMGTPKLQEDVGDFHGPGQEPDAHIETERISPLPDSDMFSEDNHSDKGDTRSEQETHMQALDRTLCNDEHSLIPDDDNQTSCRPLSPFGIRERLLPPPIPASMSSTGNSSAPDQDRSSLFNHVNFNEGLELSTKYSGVVGLHPPGTVTGQTGKTSGPDISLPPRQKKRRVTHEKASPQLLPANDGDSPIVTFSESDEDSSDSDATMSDVALPLGTSWATQNWYKAALDLRAGARPDQDVNDSTRLESAKNLVLSILRFQSTFFVDCKFQECIGRPPTHRLDYDPSEDDHRQGSLPPLQKMFALSKHDLVCVAQLVTEQALGAFRHILRIAAPPTSPAIHSEFEMVSALENIIDNTLCNYLDGFGECDIHSLALFREAARPIPRGKASNTRLSDRSRIHQRTASIRTGPDYFRIPPPHINVHRGVETWELLPSSLHFWPTLSLGPAGGAKDVQIVIVTPDDGECVALATDFVSDLGTVYEERNLGSWSNVSGFSELDEVDNLEDGVCVVSLEDENPISGVIKAYSNTCRKLGDALGKIGHLESDRPIVVLIVHPFDQQYATKYLCACFWILWQAYGNSVLKHDRHLPRSDLALQLLPVDWVTFPDVLGMREDSKLGMLATSMYDRLPPSPSSRTYDRSSSLPISASPSVELSVPPPKRISFQLNADAPSDLMHEGSVLHLAYALSPDGQWITAYWIDNTGHDEEFSSSCLKGKSFKTAVQEIWTRTLEILSARDVTWRVFIVSAKDDVQADQQRCWREATRVKPRKMPMLVTLLSLQGEPPVHLIPPIQPEISLSKSPVGVSTPASTPQGPAATASPEASGNQNHVPPTPAPSETASSMPEHDGDAHLIEVADESWGMLLSPVVLNLRPTTPNDQVLAQAILFKKGNMYAQYYPGKLQSLGLSLHWDIRIRPSGEVDEGPRKQAEVTMREVLKMFRNLSVLTKAKGMDHGGDKSTFPVHAIGALQGAAALNAFLD